MPHSRAWVWRSPWAIRVIAYAPERLREEAVVEAEQSIYGEV
jgi:hypothetical protein